MLDRSMGDTLEEHNKSHLVAVLDANRSLDRFLRRLADYCRAGSSMDGRTNVNAEFLIDNAIRASGIDKLDPAPSVVTSGEFAEVKAPACLQKVLVELLDNAAKFRSEGSGSEIEVRVDQVNSSLELSVKDNGIGFEPDSAEVIFQPLERLHGVGVYPGFGFGLAICQRIVSSLNGRIWAESQPDQGALFRASIPVH